MISMALYISRLSKSQCAPHKFFEVEHSALDSRLGVRVMILDAVQELTQTPVRVCLHLKEGTTGFAQDLQ